jgi:hypothetical protein
MAKYDEVIEKKIGGPVWENIHGKLQNIIKELLDVDESAAPELSTIYIKFKIRDEPLAPVYAVLWIRSPKRVVLGIATHKTMPHKLVTDAPNRMKYTGLTSYLRITEDSEIPSELTDWIKDAFENVRNS